ncbi:MAG: hypothetical protein Kow006_26810 [Gammaproteobacteria bacterium]
MENRVRVFLLIQLVAVLLSAFGSPAVAQTPLPQQEEEPIFQPQVERRQIDIAAIDTEDFEVGPFFGWMSIQDFGVNTLAGIRLAYHINEDLFAEATLGTTEADKTSFELLSGGVQILTPDQRDFTFYTLSLGYNLFQGESYFGAKKAFNSAIYLVGGIGNTDFGGSERFTGSLGVGYRFLATDWLSFHLTVRDHFFEHDLFGEDTMIHNWEATLSTMFFF